MTYAGWLVGMGRQAAEALFVDRCRIRRQTGTTTDPDSGQTVPVYSDLYTAQPVRIQTRGNWGERKDLGEAGVVELTVEVQLPVSVTGVGVGDRVEVTASQHDSDLVGRVFLLRDVVSKTHATANRFMGTEVRG